MNIVEHRFLFVQFFIFWFMIDLKISKSYDFIHCIGLKLQFLLLTFSSPKSLPIGVVVLGHLFDSGPGKAKAGGRLLSSRPTRAL